MKIIALCKTWRGAEYALASLKSVYKHVDKFIYLHSDHSWTGLPGENNVRELVKSFPDTDNKIIHLEYQREKDARVVDKLTDNQDRQYKQLFNEANKYPHDIKMFVDTDEIWDSEELEQAKQLIKENPDSLAFQTYMFNHFKSPLYKTKLPVSLLPVCFVRASVPYLGIRGNQTTKRIIIPVHFHHMVYTRNNLTTILEKIKNSVDVENCKTVDIQAWIRDKWNMAPSCTDSLPVAGYTSQQQELETIPEIDLPAALIGHPIVRSWQRYLGIYRENANKMEENGTSIMLNKGEAPEAQDDELADMLKATMAGINAQETAAIKNDSWQPRETQQPVPTEKEPAPNSEVLLVAGFIQELLERKQGLPLRNILEMTVLNGEMTNTRLKGQRVFKLVTNRTYHNYQLETFKTAVPEGCSRVYEVEIKLTVGNEPA